MYLNWIRWNERGVWLRLTVTLDVFKLNPCMVPEPNPNGLTVTLDVFK